MDNLLPYCGLIDARISTSEKDLPVRNQRQIKTKISVPYVSHPQFRLGFAQFLTDFCLIFLLILSLNESYTTRDESWQKSSNNLFGHCSHSTTNIR